MKAQFLPLILLVATTSFAEEDLRSKVAEANDYKSFNDVIDPDKSIFGIPLGTTEEEFIEKHGKPVGHLEFKEGETAAIYTDSIALVFQRGTLAGVLIDEDLVEYNIASRMEFPRVFPNELGSTYELSNGIKPQMSLLRIRQIVGDRLVQDHPESRFTQHFFTGNSRVELGFSMYKSKAEDDDEAYRLRSILIRPRKSE